MTLTSDHPALQLLADSLAVTSGPARPEDIAKILGHAIDATGYELVKTESNTPLRDFGDLGGEPSIGPVRFQGGIIFLRGYGCSHCGNAHWTEDDPKRRHAPGSLINCPHCGEPSRVREVT